MTRLGGGLVPIHELRRYDRDKSELHVPVVILGARALELCREVDGSPGAYKELRLGKVREIEPIVHLYAIETDRAGGADSLWQHLPHTAWLVIAARPPAEDASWRIFEDLARLLDAQRRDVVVTLHGDPQLAEVWRAYGGPPPLTVATSWADTLKPLVKDALSRKRDPLRGL